MSKTLSDLLRQKKNQFSSSIEERLDSDSFLPNNKPVDRKFDFVSDPINVLSTYANESAQEIELEMPCSSETLYIDEDEGLDIGRIQRYTPSPINQIAVEHENNNDNFIGNCESITVLQERLAKEINKNLELNASINSKTKEIGALNSLTDDLKKKNTELKTELVSTASEIAYLKGDIRKLNAAIETAGAEKTELMDEIKRIKREQEQTVALNEQRWIGRDGDRKQADDIILALRSEIEDKLQLQGKMSNEMLSLERAMGLLQNDNAMLRQRIGQIELLDREIAQLRWRINTLEATNADLTAQNSFLRATIASTSHPSHVNLPIPTQQSLPPNPNLTSHSDFKSFAASSAPSHHPPLRSQHSSMSTALSLPSHEGHGEFLPSAATTSASSFSSTAAFPRGKGSGVASSADSAGSLLSMEDFRPVAAAVRRKDGPSSHEDTKPMDPVSYKYSSKSDFQNSQSIVGGSDVGGAGGGGYSHMVNPTPIASGSRSLASLLMKDTASDSTNTMAERVRPKNNGGQKSLQHFASSATKEMIAPLGFGSGLPEGRRPSIGGPFATEKTSKELFQEFQGLDK
eukprot:gene30291-40261_t